MSRLIKSSFLLTFGIWLLAGNSANATILNGSLETGENPPNWDFTLCNINHPDPGLAARADDIENWLIEAGGVDWVGPDYWPASDGDHLIDLSSNPACQPAWGTISQEFTSLAGQKYEVLFDMAANPDCCGDVKSLEVSAANDQGTYYFDPMVNGPLAWEEKSFTFTATSNTTKLTFRSLVQSSWGPLLDNVRVNILPPPHLAIAIDIKPGSDPNCFNINGQGVIPVAILGSMEINVNDIKTDDTLLFAGLRVRVRGNRGPLCAVENVNGDDFPDLVCHFEDDPFYWTTGNDNSATLVGELFDGTPIEGADSICVVP